MVLYNFFNIILEKRSNGICEYPRCEHSYAIIHHTQRFALEQVHDPSRMIALCTEHERLAHLGLITEENFHPTQWKIREHPDKNTHTYAIDMLVQKYRMPKTKDFRSKF